MEAPTQAPRRSTYTGYESMSLAVLLIAFAIAVLLGWMGGSFVLFIQIFLIEAGVYYVVLGIISPREERRRKPGLNNAMYLMFWGGTLALIGVEWMAAGVFDVSGVVLFVIFILWIGLFALLLSLPGMRKS